MASAPLASPGSLQIQWKSLCCISDWSQGLAPEEACGLLIGRRLESGFAIERVTHADNTLPAEQRLRGFAVEPMHLLREESKADQEGLLLLGSWHSHPRGTAEPSLRDIRASWAGSAILIISAAGCGLPSEEPLQQFRCWRRQTEGIHELALVTHGRATHLANEIAHPAAKPAERLDRSLESN